MVPLHVKVADFCCGANDFSIAVRDKLVKAGKINCEFKNFDILAPKVGVLIVVFSVVYLN
jgi:hypothetical protein